MYERFELLLQLHGVTRHAVAKATGIAESTLSTWAYGKSTPGIDKLKLIADYFDVSLDYLAGRDEQVKDESPDKIHFASPYHKALFNKTKDLTPEQAARMNAIFDLITEEDQHND